MTNFESFKMKNVQRKHWSVPSSWGMAEVMHSVLLNATKTTFAYVAYISIFVDEVMTIRKTQCLSIHFYVVHVWILVA
jgi:hypothetical protein